jgi:rhodanese-related sulfurtransferase
MHNLRKLVSQDFVKIILILVTSLILAIVVNAIHPMGLPIRLNKVKNPGMPEWVWNKLKSIDVKTAFDEISNGRGILVDVRMEKDYKNEHVQGAINLPYYEFEKFYPDFVKKVSKEEPLYLYCYGGVNCVLSSRVAKRLLVLGYKDLTTIRQGFSAWKKLNLPTDNKTQQMK